MSTFQFEPVLVRGADAETISHATGSAHLLTDASSTAGALSAHRVTLAKGADGATPHFHADSSELFYVLDGSLQMLHDDKIIYARQGDLVVVPPRMPHAFAAAADSTLEMLIAITPGVERFDYFRILGRVVNGEAPFSELVAGEDKFDSHSVDSPVWREARAS